MRRMWATNACCCTALEFPHLGFACRTSAAKDGAACIAKLRDLVGIELRRAASDASGQQKVCRTRLDHVHDSARNRSCYTLALRAFQYSQRERTEKQRDLTKRFKTASKQFTQSVKATQNLSQRSSQRAAGATAPHAGGEPGQQQGQEQQLLDSHAIDHQRAMFREREEEARRLAGEMATLQDIMGDLNQQVAVQGEMIDDIETNVTSAEDRADKGVEHLEKASTYQKIFTSRAMWLVAILVLIGGGVAAVIVLTHK